MIIALVNEKGGCGKTTLAVHVACWLADQGLDVAFVDADRQQSARRWISKAAPDMPLTCANSGEEVVAAIDEYKMKHAYVVCDGPPRLDAPTLGLMYMADLIIIPVTPSTVDLRATLAAKQTIDRVGEAQQRDGIAAGRVMIVMNRLRARTELSRTVTDVLREMDLPVADTALGLRDAYAKAATRDTVVTRMKDKSAQQAADEFNQLMKEILDEHCQRQAA
jgi:chromosome partitioning protein